MSTAPLRRIVLTPPEVANLLGVSKSTIYRWMETGALPVVQMGGSSRKFIPMAPFLAIFGVVDAGQSEVTAKADASGRFQTRTWPVES